MTNKAETPQPPDGHSYKDGGSTMLLTTGKDQPSTDTG